MSRAAAERGAAQTPARGARIASRGIVAHAPGVLVSLTCETDLVARSSTFERLAQEIADLASASGAASQAETLALVTNGRSVAEALAELSAQSGDEVVLGEVVRLPGTSAGQLHVTASGLPPRVGSLISWTGDPDQRLVDRLLLQVAMCSPTWVTPSAVPAEVIDAVRAEATQWTAAQQKPEWVVDRIVAGKVEAFLHETVLSEQVSIADPGVLIDDLLRGTGVHITGFARVEVGVSPW